MNYKAKYRLKSFARSVAGFFKRMNLNNKQKSKLKYRLKNFARPVRLARLAKLPKLVRPVARFLKKMSLFLALAAVATISVGIYLWIEEIAYVLLFAFLGLTLTLFNARETFILSSLLLVMTLVLNLGGYYEMYELLGNYVYLGLAAGAVKYSYEIYDESRKSRKNS